MFAFVGDKIDFAYKEDYASSLNDQYYKHMHHFYELLYFLDGEVEYVVEQERKKLKRGDLILIRPGSLHFADVRRTTKYCRYVLKFDESVLPSFLQERLSKGNAFNHFAEKELFEKLETIATNYEQEEANALLIGILIEILIHLSHQETNQTTAETTYSSHVIAYVEQHIKEKLSLESIASALGLSKSYLSALFVKDMKVPLMHYVRSKKVIEARKAILQGKKASDAANEFGFEDYSTFYRSYIKFIGVPPTKK